MKERNLTFTILSAIGIVLILLGHLDFGVLTLGGLFPYYSYHVMIFVFVAGYFYKEEDEENIPGFLIRKTKSLMLPYFIWNVIYGLLCMFLKLFGFEFGGNISLYNLFVAPFMGGHQFGLNAPSWFVPALFLLEVCNILGRMVFKGSIRCIKKIVMTIAGEIPDMAVEEPAEWIIMAVYLIMGIVAVYLAQRGSVYDYYKIPGRIMLMAPAFQFGRLYKTKLENIDKLPTVIYMGGCLFINLILTFIHVGLAYSTVWVTGFGATPLTPFITMFTGIALWLRISRLLALGMTKGTLTERVVSFIGTHTFDAMTHHLTIFLIIKIILYLIGRIGHVFEDFDVTAFRTDIYYTYVPAGIESFKWVYLAIGIALSQVIYITERIRQIKASKH